MILKFRRSYSYDNDQTVVEPTRKNSTAEAASIRTDEETSASALTDNEGNLKDSKYIHSFLQFISFE